MSALVPGLGQVYNKKYWKVPVIYGALIGGGYAIQFNRANYIRSKNAYKARIDNDPATVDTEFPASTSDQQLVSDMEYYRKWMEIGYIATGLVYVLNIVDATVDAHLFTFDISDDLTLRLMPGICPYRTGKGSYAGVNINFSF